MIRPKHLIVAASFGALSVMANAQTAPAQPTVAPAPMSILAPRGDAGSEVETFYAARNNALIWLKDDSTRTAAVAFADILRKSNTLDDARDLASRIDSAITANDDKAISSAWVRYVQALRAPVRGMNYGDLALTPKSLTPSAILAQASLAPSLAEHVRQTAAVNPFYSALLDAAVKQGAASDPRVRATLDRLRPIPSSGKFIVVDAANAQLMMVDNGTVVGSMKVIVGKPANKTPLLAGTIHYVTFNPYWHIPSDVAQRKVAPVVLKRGVSYLKAARYETVAAFGAGEDPIDPTTVDWKGVADGSVKVYIRQLNGPNNMMGKMKFGFINDYGVYLHDTPHKELFEKAKRNLSLGCIRLEHPERLAQWVLGREPVPPHDGVELQVPIDKGIPIYVTYMTARPDNGAIAFANDIYGWDSPGTVEVAKVAVGEADAAAQAAP